MNNLEDNLITIRTNQTYYCEYVIQSYIVNKTRNVCGDRTYTQLKNNR